MHGYPGLYEAKVSRGDRLTYHLDEDVIVLRVNCTHDILRNP
jgi:hypothetical protein